MRLSFDENTSVLTVPEVPGVDYKIDGETVSGEIEIYEDTTVTAEPQPGYQFPDNVDTSWTFTPNSPQLSL